MIIATCTIQKNINYNNILSQYIKGINKLFEIIFVVADVHFIREDRIYWNNLDFKNNVYVF